LEYVLLENSTLVFLLQNQVDNTFFPQFSLLTSWILAVY